MLPDEEMIVREELNRINSNASPVSSSGKLILKKICLTDIFGVSSADLIVTGFEC